MGLLSGLKSMFLGSDAASQAAGQANIFSEQGIGELRGQFGASQEALAPFIQAGAGAIPGLVQGSTAGGLDARLAELFNTDIFGSLVEERGRAVEGQLAAGGQTRSGAGLAAAAAVPTDIGLMLEQLLSGREQTLATSGQAAAMGQGQLGGDMAARVAQMFGQQGQNVASGILGDAQSDAAAAQNVVNLATTAASIFFSDPALKENIEAISNIGDLTLYEWDWIEGAKGTMIEKCGTTGFMADEVAQKYPQHVGEYGGFMVIDYPALLDELEASPCLH